MNSEKEKNNDFTQGIEVGRREGKSEALKEKSVIKLMEMAKKAGKVELIKELRTLHNQKGLSALLNCLGLQEK